MTSGIHISFQIDLALEARQDDLIQRIAYIKTGNGPSSHWLEDAQRYLHTTEQIALAINTHEGSRALAEFATTIAGIIDGQHDETEG